MINTLQAQLIHRILIEKFGGSQGVRDISALESAVTRPFQTFDNNEFYGPVLEKAAALIESILNNHPFVDGNKRIGYVLLRMFLINNDIDITASIAPFTKR